MRIITVRQPWAWALIHGGKDVENRTRNIAGSYRGPIAIHVGLQFAEAASPLDLQVARAVGETTRAGGLHDRVVSRIADEDRHENHVAPWFGQRGAIIGVVDLAEVHYDVDCLMHGGPGHYGSCSTWAMADHWHLCVNQPRPLAEPIPTKGKLGLWKPGDDLLAAIREQVA